MKVTLISCIVTKYFSPLCIAFVSDDWPISHDGLLNLSSSASTDRWGRRRRRWRNKTEDFNVSIGRIFLCLTRNTNRWFRLRSDRYFIRRVALKVSISEFKLTVKLSNLRNLFWTTRRKNQIWISIMSRSSRGCREKTGFFLLNHISFNDLSISIKILALMQIDFISFPFRQLQKQEKLSKRKSIDWLLCAPQQRLDDDVERRKKFRFSLLLAICFYRPIVSPTKQKKPK